MLQRCRCALWTALIFLSLAGQPARASDEAVSTAMPVEEGAAVKQRGHWLPWNWPKDEGWNRRKESCRFIFGPTGPYMYPNQYMPHPGYPSFNMAGPYPYPRPW